jgi:hypothetical protein
MYFSIDNSRHVLHVERAASSPGQKEISYDMNKFEDPPFSIRLNQLAASTFTWGSLLASALILTYTSYKCLIASCSNASSEPYRSNPTAINPNYWPIKKRQEGGHSSKLTYLSSPITEVVHGDHLPATGPIDVCQELTDDCRP